MNKILKIIILIVLLFIHKINFGQLGSLGANLLSDADYAKLPRIDWADIKQYSSNSNISQYRVSGIRMLVAPPVGNQQTQGSCVGWAVGYSAMGMLAYRKYGCWQNAARSASFIYNQIKVPGNCGAGSYTADAIMLATSLGVCSEALMPYNTLDCITKPNSTQIANALQNKALKWGFSN